MPFIIKKIPIGDGQPINGSPWYTDGVITHILIIEQVVDLTEQKIIDNPETEFAPVEVY